MKPHRFDALILTALLDELEPVLAFSDGSTATWRKERDSKSFPYHVRELTPETGGPPLLIAAASFNAMGASITAARATALIEELNPACLAMCGICAGNKKEVALGDVIVADRLYDPEAAGKRTVSAGEDGQWHERLDHNLRTYNLEDTWRVNAEYFARELDWTVELLKERPPTREAQVHWLLSKLLEYEQRGEEIPHELFTSPEREALCPEWDTLWDWLKLPKSGALMAPGGRPKLTEAGREKALELRFKYGNVPKERPFKIHVGAIATGSVVQKDPGLFPRLEQLVRKTLGAEMEAMAIGLVAEHLQRRAIVVKAASDYGDGEKNDLFRKFAARASAEVLLRFLRRELEPSVRSPAGGDGLESLLRDPSGRPRHGSELLSRVKAFTHIKEEGTGWRVEIVEKPLHSPLGHYLHVTKSRGPQGIEYPVAAVEQLTPELLDAFLTGLHERYRIANPRVTSVLVYEGPEPDEELRTKAWDHGILLQAFAEYMGLLDFSGFLREQSQRLESDSEYPPRLYVDQRAVMPVPGQEVPISNALDQLQRWMKDRQGNLVLVLGDFGTGKTFLLRKLALLMTAGAPHGPIPFFIELRKLEKKPTLDELLAAQIAQARLNHLTVATLRCMLGDGQIALLFDGFDEYVQRVTYARAAEHLSILLEGAQDKANIVITSRTQHFETEQQVREVLARRPGGVRGYHLLKLQPFDTAQIHQFLEKRLETPSEAEERFRLLEELPNLPELAVNPRMLSFILNLPKEALLKAKERDQTMTRARLYEHLLHWWLTGETTRVSSEEAGPELSTRQRWSAVTELAMRLWLSGEPAIPVQQLPDEFIGELQKLEHWQIDPDVARHQIGSRTLLIRDEQKKFSFIHQSVMEWLVAKRLEERLWQNSPIPELGQQTLSRLMVDFLCELAGRKKAAEWAQAALAMRGEGLIHKNAQAILDRLGIKPTTRMNRPGEDLRGEDLSGKDLRNANLREAVLTGVSLAGADLTGATLAKAQLQRADLSGANLEHADLSDADLTGARLLGAKLMGATLEGTRFREAKLVKASFDPPALKGREKDFWGAALPTSGPPAPMVSADSFYQTVAYSPDGRLLAGGGSGSVQLWDVENGLMLRIFQGHEGLVTSVAFSPDGQTLASGSLDSTVRLWNVLTGSERRVLKGHSQSVYCVAFSPDGRTLASGSDDDTVRLWDPLTGSERRVLKGHSGSVLCVAFSPDGRTLASSSFDNTVRLWNPLTGSKRRVLKGHSRGIRNVAFSPDGQTLASGSHDKTVRLWDALTGAERRVLKGHSQSVHCVAFSPDGQTLASGSEDKTVRLWDTLTRSEHRVLKSHSETVWSLAFSPDGQTLASASYDQTVRLWDALTGSERRVLKGHAQSVYCVAFSPDGQTLALGSQDNTVRQWDAHTGSERRVLKGHSESVHCVAFSPDGQTLASGSFDNTVCLWNPLTGSKRRVLKGHSQAIWGVAFSPDGQTLASGSQDKTVRLWDALTGAEHRVLKGHSQSVYCVAFSPDGRTLASGSEDKTVRLWDALTGSERRVLKGHSQHVFSMAFSPDGQTLASGSFDQTVRLWDALTGSERRVLKGHSQSVYCVAFSPDGQTLASGSYDQTVRLWDAHTGSERRVLKGHSQSVWSVTFSPDGQTLASGSVDNTVRLWDAASGKCLAVLVSLPEGWVAFTPDGHYRSKGTLGGAFWYAISLCRFELGELEPYLPLRVSDDAPLDALHQ